MTMVTTPSEDMTNKSLEQKADYLIRTYGPETLAGKFAADVLEKIPHYTIDKLQSMTGVHLHVIKFADNDELINIEYYLNYHLQEDDIDPEDSGVWYTYQNDKTDPVVYLDIKKPLEVMDLDKGTFKTTDYFDREVFLQFFKTVPLKLTF